MSFGASSMQSQFVRPDDVGAHGIYEIGNRSRQHRRVVSRSKLRGIVPVTVGISAIAAFIALTDGGNNAREVLPIAFYAGQALEKVGLGLTEVTLKGQRMTRDTEIYDQLELKQSRSIWLLDTEAARKRVEQLPWVQSAVLKRIYPDRLHIDIVERLPQAIWNDGRRTVLLDTDGKILGPAAQSQWTQLPVVFGADANSHVGRIVAMTNLIPALKDRIGLFEWTAKRRWTLHLKSGRQVLLPAGGEHLGLQQLTRGAVGDRLLDSDFEKLDLRVASQAAVEFRK